MLVLLVCDWPDLGDVGLAALGDEAEAGAEVLTVLVGAAIPPRCLRRPACSEDIINS